MTDDRVAKKAAIKRATKTAQRDMDALDRATLDDLSGLYRQAAGDIEREILGYADGAQTLRLEVLQTMLGQVRARLSQLESARNELLEGQLVQAAQLGVAPFAESSALLGQALPVVADEAVRFVRSFVGGDGLQLSDRLWVIDRQARDEIAQAIESAVIQGHSASRAAQEFLARGQPVPSDVAGKFNMARAGTVAKGAGAALTRTPDSAYSNALRLFRTELNRAHGEAYVAGALAHPEAGGVRYLLSPGHPRPDICDMHASANIYGLGPGVYPDRGRCPWPPHPNIKSYLEIVFADEITAADRAGKQTRLEWIAAQPAALQADVLGGQRKQRAFAQGVLREGEIATPWRVLKEKYAKKGIEIRGPSGSPRPAPAPAPPVRRTRPRSSPAPAAPVASPPDTTAAPTPARPFRTFKALQAWADSQGTLFRPGTATLAAINSGLSGIRRVLDPQGIKLTALHFNQALEGAALAVSGNSRPGSKEIIHYIKFAPGANKNPQVAAQSARQSREFFSARRSREIDRLSTALANVAISGAARSRVEDLLRRVLATQRWSAHSDARITEPLAAIGSHEAGHTLYYVRELPEKWEAALNKNGATMLDYLGVSEYGATELTELFAEVTAMVHNGLIDLIPQRVLLAYREVVDAVDAVP